MIIQFNKVLNDLYSYFLLADVAVLRHYQQQNQLSNDLAHEFTTTNYGDDVITNGIMIVLAGMTDGDRAFEFLIKPTNEPKCTADVFKSFAF